MIITYLHKWYIIKCFALNLNFVQNLKENDFLIYFRIGKSACNSMGFIGELFHETLVKGVNQLLELVNERTILNGIKLSLTKVHFKTFLKK